MEKPKESISEQKITITGKKQYLIFALIVVAVILAGIGCSILAFEMSSVTKEFIKET